MESRIKVHFLEETTLFSYGRMAVIWQKDRRYTKGWGLLIYEPLHGCATSTARWLLICCPEVEVDLVVALPHTHNTVSAPNFDANNSQTIIHTITATCYWWSCGKECTVPSQSCAGLRGTGACAVAAHSRSQEWGNSTFFPKLTRTTFRAMNIDHL